MRLENALKHFYPKSSTFNNKTASTSPDSIKSMDAVAAIGITERHASIGIAAFLAKNDISEKDKIKVINALTQYAIKSAPKLIRKLAGNKLKPSMMILSKLAFKDYATSACSTYPCVKCKGKGLIYSRKDVIKHPGIFNKEGYKLVDPLIRNEQVEEVCKKCNGKGKISHLCRCKGRGIVLNVKETKLRGIAIYKNCPRCTGNGYTRMPSSVAFNIIKRLIPTLNVRTWQRNWKPFYDKLVDLCYVEEAKAKFVFNEITR